MDGVPYFSNDAVHAEVHHAGGHEKGAAAADKSAEYASDEPEQDDLQGRVEIAVDVCDKWVHRSLLNASANRY